METATAAAAVVADETNARGASLKGRFKTWEHCGAAS